MCLSRNKRTIYYALYQGKTPVLDENGYETGELRLSYSDPVALRANVSPASGTAQIEQFGNLDSYDRVIVVCNMDCPIDENTVLFVEKQPEYRDGIPLYDYIVRRVAKSLNSISIAIAKVSTS